MKSSLNLFFLSWFLLAGTMIPAAQAALPNFSARHDYVSPGSFICVGDVNGDGFPDIIGVSNLGIQVLLGSGKGIFGSGPPTSMSLSGTYVPVVADFNGDGKLDIAFEADMGSGYITSGLLVSLGNGDGTFQAGQFYPLSSSPNVDIGPLAVGDFNGDGIPDLAISGAPGVWMFLGKGDGTFQTPLLTALTSSGDIAAADLNGDGKLDLAVSGYTGFGVLLGNGDGTFQPALYTTMARPQLEVVVGDVNLDGKPDLVLVAADSNSNSYALYLGNGDGTFTGPARPGLPGGGFVAIGDVNSDGKPDLVNSEAYIVLGNGKGQFGAAKYYPTESAPLGSSQVFLADLRNNGRLDIVEGNGIYVSVLLNRGEGKYEDGDFVSVTGGARCGATADFNLDGHQDLAVTTETGVTLFYGTGKETEPFIAGPAFPVSGAACLLAGDFNNDGIPDLLVGVNNPSIAANLYLGKGNGTFTLASSTLDGTGGFLALGDFNHDGNLDWASSANLLALGNGDGTFQTPVPLIPSCTPLTCALANIAAADLNHDGWTDVVLTLSSDKMFVLINNQQGGFVQTTYTEGLGGFPYGIAIGDLNGDGNPDIFTAFEENDGGAIYLGNGRGGFGYKETLSMPNDFSGIPLIADINGDGIPDILLACQSTTAVFLGKGSATFETPFYLGTGPSPEGILPMNLHGQAVDAGLPDLVYPDASGFIVVLTNLTQ